MSGHLALLFWQTAALGGTTLLVDYPFPAYPDDQRHWAEILLPAYSVLQEQAWLAVPESNHSQLGLFRFQVLLRKGSCKTLLQY